MHSYISLCLLITNGILYRKVKKLEIINKDCKEQHKIDRDEIETLNSEIKIKDDTITKFYIELSKKKK